MTRCSVCCHVICLSVLQHYYFYNHRTDPLVYLSVYGFVMTMFSIGLAIGVIIAVGMLFYIQVQCHNHNFSLPQLWDSRERRQENTILDSFKDNNERERERERVHVCVCVKGRCFIVFNWCSNPFQTFTVALLHFRDFLRGEVTYSGYAEQFVSNDIIRE